MRITTIFLVALSGLAFIVAILLALQARAFQRDSVTAHGVVVQLTSSPLHSKVKVSPSKGEPFVYGENSRTALSVGESILVRYDPTAPQQTAQLASESVYDGAFDFIILGVGGLVFALISPFLVRRFPGLLAYGIRP